MKILRLGETTHGQDFCVSREKGYPHYLFLLIETPALVETQAGWHETPAHTAILFQPFQKHSYRAKGASYTDCWVHIECEPLLFDGFPFGMPLPLCEAGRFYALFHVMQAEFFAERRTRKLIVSSIANALLEMLCSEVEVKNPYFYSFLSLREQIFHSPANHWKAEDAARGLGVSVSYFHALYKQWFHTTFHADVIVSRIQTAEELLLSTPDSVAQISERCGYLSPEHFIRQFRQTTGLSPQRYRHDKSKPKPDGSV